jgi:hypothetical protein
MNFLSHFTFGVFTGLLVYYMSGRLLAGIFVFLIQIALILDFLFKKAIDFEPLHSLSAMIVVWLATFFVFPLYHWYVLFAYFTHLFLDIFVHEEIPLLWPSTKQLMYPIKHSEKFVQIVSVIGTLVIIVFMLV